MRSISSGSESLAYDKNASRESLLSSEATALTLSSDATNDATNGATSLARRRSLSTRSDRSTTVSMGTISNKSRDPLPPPPYTPTEQLVELFKACALYDFTAENEGELSLAKGDVIRVLSKIDDGWWTGEIEGTSRSGMFPANYVEKAAAAGRDKPQLKPVHSYSADSVGLATSRLRAEEESCKARKAWLVLASRMVGTCKVDQQ